MSTIEEIENTTIVPQSEMEVARREWNKAQANRRPGVKYQNTVQYIASQEPGCDAALILLQTRFLTRCGD